MKLKPYAVAWPDRLANTTCDCTVCVYPLPSQTSNYLLSIRRRVSQTVGRNPKLGRGCVFGGSRKVLKTIQYFMFRYNRHKITVCSLYTIVLPEHFFFFEGGDWGVLVCGGVGTESGLKYYSCTFGKFVRERNNRFFTPLEMPPLALFLYCLFFFLLLLQINRFGKTNKRRDITPSLPRLARFVARLWPSKLEIINESSRSNG